MDGTAGLMSDAFGTVVVRLGGGVQLLIWKPRFLSDIEEKNVSTQIAWVTECQLVWAVQHMLCQYCS